MMSGDGVAGRRVSQPWVLLAGLTALAAAVLALWWRHALREDWLSDMQAADCSPVLELPQVGLLVWGAIAGSLLAGGLFLAHAWTSHGRRTRDVVIGSALAVFALGVLAGSLLLATTTPTDPVDGLDGSGLPCGSSV